MTRINLVPPRLLTDQHLVAEIKEINQLAGQFRRSITASTVIQPSDLPDSYRLGKGHVKFFYNKRSFLLDRFERLCEEGRARGFGIIAEFRDVWLGLPYEWDQPFVPTQQEIGMSKRRIMERVRDKPELYRWFGRRIWVDHYETALYNENENVLKEKVA